LSGSFAPAADPIRNIEENAMKLRVFGLLATSTFGSLLGGAQALAQNAYITNNTSPGTVSVIDTTTNAVTGTIAVGSFPFGVAVSPDGSSLYVANARSGTVSVIAAAGNAVINVPGSCSPAIGVGSFPQGVAVTPDGRKVYVANAGDNTVSVIDTGTNAVSTITDPSFNHPVAFGVFIAPLVVQLAPLSGTAGNVANVG
jgi:YVTN family beta-propeller protein